MSKSTSDKTSLFDLSELVEVTQGTCEKCKKVGNVYYYYIIKGTRFSAYFCKDCFLFALELNARVMKVANGHPRLIGEYTKQIRCALFRWFMAHDCLTKQLTDIELLAVLKAAGIIVQLDLRYGKPDFNIKPKKHKLIKEELRKKQKKAYDGPWKHDFKNNCVKCNRAFHLQRHHIIYDPPITAFLCHTCHERITRLNTAAAKIAHTSKKYKLKYTNQVRVRLWKWFIKESWPIDADGKAVKTPSETKIKDILKRKAISGGQSELRPSAGL